jgi:hypothetical protein
MSTIIYIGGDKGGVGKSMVSIAICDFLKHRLNKPVLLIETDTANPDAAKCLKDELDTVIQADTSKEDGWQAVLNTIEAQSDTTITVINAGARDNRAMEEYGHYLSAGATTLNATLVVGWVVNAERDCLLALKTFLEIYDGRIFVIGNRFFDESGQFELYQASKVRQEIERRGGELLIFPALPHMLATAIRNDRRSPAEQRRNAPLFEKIALDQWRNGAERIFEKMLAVSKP